MYFVSGRSRYGTATGLEVTTNSDDADIILVNNEGIIAPGTGDLVAAWGKRKQIIFLGPSTAGVSRIQQQEHWCPYGKQTPDFIPLRHCKKG